MRFPIFVAVILTLCCPALAAAQLAVSADFYVAPDGDDVGDGSRDEPFATPARAQQAVRELVAAGLDHAVLVYFREGIYPFDAPLAFDVTDSGSEQYGVTYAAYPGEEVSFNGGARLLAEWFAPVTDAAILDRLLPEARDEVLVVDLPAHGVTDYGELFRRGFNFDNGPLDDDTPPAGLEIFVNGRPLQLARYPNDEYLRVAAAPGGPETLQFRYSGDRPDRWTEAADPWFYGHWNAFWADCFFPVQSIDTATRTVNIKPISEEEIERWGWNEGDAWGNYGIEPSRPYFALNLLEEIDVPGEWYLDREEGLLYVYPTADFATADIFVSLADELLQLDGAAHLTFENLTFEVVRNMHFKVSDGVDVAFHRCTFRDAGSAVGRVIGEASGIDSSHIYGIGGTVVGLKGGDRYDLIEAENYLTNSHIHDYAFYARMGTMAVNVRGVGQIVAHNLIHDAPHMAVLFKENEHTIESNEIFNLCWDADDAGTIYVGRDWGARGTEIRHNFIHHINSSLHPWQFGELVAEGVHGVYLDDTSCGNYTVGNVFYEVDKRGVMIGGGRDNVVENNIMANMNSALFIDRRGLARTPEQNESLWNKLVPYNVTEPPWSTYYPELAAMYDDPTPYEPDNNHVNRNMAHERLFWVEQGFWGSSVWEVLMGLPLSFLIFEDNLPNVEDPGFVDEANLDLSLRPDSPAYTIPGWEEIPFSEIGLILTPPELEIALASDKAAVIQVRGITDPWASIASATLDGRDVAASLTVASNGMIRGTIDLSEVSQSPVVLEVVVADPKGRTSDAGFSNELDVPVGDDDDTNSDDDADDDTNGDDDAVDDDASGDDDDAFGDDDNDDDAGCGC
ncbi:MAG: right-handed parallel beta-helix repeat-containing protein [Candidatus Lernaella stagnicola]|nr:right-handed parallel beta-helix repeat-containing protein [Candidatus Lernaella stagnicola]